ncbi:hypothetical protein Ob7_02170 [Thermosipho africanus Ob7]|nr:hypothetical protein Ob7_02170 [Thermosipho africanus Ob7]
MFLEQKNVIILLTKGDNKMFKELLHYKFKLEFSQKLRG